MLEIGLGTSSLPGNLGQVEAIEFIRTAHNLGVNFLDTSPLYFASEDLIGKVDFRNNLRLCSKFGLSRKKIFPKNNFLTMPINRFALHLFKPERAMLNYTNNTLISKSLYNSLNRLRVNSIDTFLYHSVESEVQLNIAKPKLLELRNSGLVNRIGFSIDRFIPMDTSWCDVIQVPMIGIDWYRQDQDLIVNRIFADSLDYKRILANLVHANRNVTLLTGTTKSEKIEQFTNFVETLK